MLDTSTDPNRIWLGNLPPRTTEYFILKLVKQFGELADFTFPVHKVGPQKGATTGYCFVTFKTREAAQLGLRRLNGLRIGDHTLSARLAKPSKEETLLAQSSLAEAQRQKIEDETKKREEELARILMDKSTTATYISKKIDEPLSTPLNKVSRPKVMTVTATPIPDLYGKLGQISAKPLKSGSSSACSPGSQPQSTSNNLTISRIEATLRRLEREDATTVQPAILRSLTSGVREDSLKPHPALTGVLTMHRDIRPNTKSHRHRPYGGQKRDTWQNAHSGRCL
ncbi:unnamed protein product [Schistocephalus solidus]|uniref:Putative RNA-binding protein 18 n=1 Tax=Schistocephalus solidus TaxID=70667 RepID=A0A183STJ0_SCHSO|nr:unnamed protein product [Schistocephalus solidus]